jgi:hypothetical protein
MRFLNVTVDLFSEVVTCIKDKDKKIISGIPEKNKKNLRYLGFFKRHTI